MREGIHPEYNEVTISCACGATFNTKSIKQYNIDVCSACHPHYTGKARLLDAEGRVERFKKRYQKK
ncbi:MAG: 50S ribosomal protein L31 [Myxococcales bacterium]|nr:50S ribosomal protein L31 [Myxococcales bacterium]|tara:strand:+ start:397 stop:594 length:198 start_codon:yes stop_codon:yes gene_type:complete